MKHLLTSVILIACMFAFAVSPIRAERLPVVTPVVGTPSLITYGWRTPPTECQFGNLNPATFAVGAFMLPPEEYQLVFLPLSTCSSCEVGFGVTTIHVVLQSGAACTITMSVGIGEASYPNDPGCPEPGIEWCTSTPTLVTLPAAGLHDISIPLYCPCLAIDREYLIKLSIESASCGGDVPDLVMDASPHLCTNWNNYGSGPYDLVDQYPTWPGDLLFYAEGICCSPSVPTEHETWGAIKSLYSE
ncbi:MAG: hypothetical protein HY770_05490 [Chitinivibrionia bacterium]|nr:hypothetical protein [Chitinivibrionia bacterium]